MSEFQTTGHDIELTVSDFVGLLNQSLEYAFPNVIISGELANFRVSKNRWVYFDLKDEQASVKFFGTVYQLPGPLENGMLLRVRGQPRLHPLYGFSVTVMQMQPAGEGSIRRAAELLQAKLAAEGLFDDNRKRLLPYPPQRIGLIASKQSAAYADFIKILNARWQGIDIQLVDVQVQGEVAPAQIVQAFELLNAEAGPPEIIVLIRGGGSAEDLAAFSTEIVTRAVAASRVPTLVAIGHEVDLSLAELAADRRASTPSNAAEFLTPDKAQVTAGLQAAARSLEQLGNQRFRQIRLTLQQTKSVLDQQMITQLQATSQQLKTTRQLLQVLSPQAILRRGYAIIRANGKPLIGVKTAQPDTKLEVQLHDGRFTAIVQKGK